MELDAPLIKKIFHFDAPREQYHRDAAVVWCFDNCCGLGTCIKKNVDEFSGATLGQRGRLATSPQGADRDRTVPTLQRFGPAGVASVAAIRRIDRRIKSRPIAFNCRRYRPVNPAPLHEIDRAGFLPLLAGSRSPGSIR